MQKIGIVGQGFVGGAIKAGFKDHFELFLYDKFSKEKSNTDLRGVVLNSDVIFVCVPTPMDANTGEASISIVQNVVLDIDIIANQAGITPTLIIKSTVPPGTTERLNSFTISSNVVFNPEFLTEANAVEDFKNQNRIIIGTCNEYPATEVVDMFKQVFPSVLIVVENSKEAEMCKYITNTFLSVKVSFANEIHDICEANGIDYDVTKDLAVLDDRLGTSHWMVPGPDGDRGYGGHCFPKDIGGLCYVAKESGVDVNVLKGTIATNDRVRADRDWESQDGRAIINYVPVEPSKVKSFFRKFFA
jgi:UDPglucose 6-dehydrogenase